MGLPSGTVSFLFTDIEGSTGLLLKGEEQYARLLDDHRRVLRAAFSRHGGQEVDTQGDAFFVVFARAKDAVASATDAQRELSVPVRMGIHTGEPLVGDEGYVGLSVHRAARIAHAAHGGQVIISEATRGLLLDEELELRDLGEHRLKDLAAAQRLFQVGTENFPPLRTLDVSRTNLPSQPTRFLGRERELEEVLQLLREGDVRLLTLTGPGGTGKTRLALQAAVEAVDDLAAGAWFVGLAAERERAGTRTLIAGALGLTNPASLEAYLAERQLLLVLDNLEQIEDAGVVVAELLRAAPAVRVLATSREPLKVAGEQEYQVPPMSAADAVALFARRARAVDSRFALEDNRSAVEEICERVDRLPLAIELAAARTKLLSPAALLQRLDQALPLLKANLTDVPARHQTLAAAIAWSYDLLPGEEREFFRRLGVFGGSFTIDAAAAVAASDLDPLETLADLVDKSLVVPTDGDEEPRFRLLRTIAEFAQGRLRVDDDEAGAWRRLAHYLARRGLELEARHGIGTGVARAQWLRDGPNLLAAVRWTHAHDEEAFVRLLTNTWEIVRSVVPRDEAERLSAVALGRIGESDLVGRVNLLTILSSTRRRRGDIDGAIAAADERIRILGRLDDPQRLGIARNDRGAFLMLNGDFDQAEHEFDSAVSLFTRAGNSTMAAVAKSNAANMVAARGDFVRSLQLLEDLDMTSSDVACMAICLGDLERGATLAEKAYHRSRGTGGLEVAANCLDLLSVVAQRQDDCRLAARLMGGSDQLLRDQGINTTFRVPYEHELFDEARAQAQGKLGEAEFKRAAAEGADLARAGRNAELLGRFASEPQRQDGISSPV